MGKVISSEIAGPDDPIYKEPITRHNPLWGQAYLQSKQARAAEKAPPEVTAGHVPAEQRNPTSEPK